MTIKEVKKRLSILTFLSDYGFTPNTNNMFCCPFHSDKKSSMRIYLETNTVYCFAGNCEASNLDNIDFNYQSVRKGLYPAYPSVATKTLIIGESIIDILLI